MEHASNEKLGVISRNLLPSPDGSFGLITKSVRGIRNAAGEVLSIIPILGNPARSVLNTIV